MYRITNKETGQVYFEADSIDALNDMAQPAFDAHHIHCLRGKDSYTHHYSKLTPELLAMLGIRLSIMDKVAGMLMLALIIVLVLGLAGAFG